MKYDDKMCTNDCQTCGGSLTNKECSERANRSLPLFFLFVIAIIYIIINNY